ncbi:MAG: hypothetical protein ACRC1Z_18490, partial [Waterburya sp.]
MKKVLILQGLPASGKSQFARELLLANPGRWVRTNKDLQQFASKHGTINDYKNSSSMKAYSVDFREKIVSAIEKGDSSVRKVA